MKFTKEQRLDAYTYALLSLLENDIERPEGVCDILYNYGKEIGLYTSYFEFEPSHFDEFYTQKPVNKFSFQYWFDDIEQRINAVCKAIELLDSKTT